MARNLTPYIPSPYGAQFGRPSYTVKDIATDHAIYLDKDGRVMRLSGEEHADDAEVYETIRQMPHRFYLQHARLDNGGYDRGGAYWGHGDPVYIAQNYEDTVQRSYRAKSRAQAAEELLEEFPNARINGYKQEH